MKTRTSQQNSIYQVLDELGRPAPAKVLWELASNIVPGLGLATVYRALKALSKEGKVRKIEVEGLAPHYEKMRDEHTHYFVCEDCHTMFDLHGCPGGFTKLLPPGFVMTKHEIFIYGACQDCV